MSMDLYHTYEGVEGFIDKAHDVCQVKGTSTPDRIEQIVAAKNAVSELLNTPRQQQVIMAVRAGDVQKATEAVTDLALWSGLNTDVLTPVDNVAVSACMDEWGVVVQKNHDAIACEFNRHAATLGKITSAGQLFNSSDPADLVRTVEQGGQEQFKAVVAQRDACAALTRLARLMLLNMSLGSFLPLHLPAGIDKPEGRSIMLAEVCFDPKQFADNTDMFTAAWKGHDDMREHDWVAFADYGFIPHARSWNEVWEASQDTCNQQ